MHNKKIIVLVWCFVFLAVGCQGVTVSNDNRPCEAESGACLPGYECDYSTFTCVECVDETQSISCEAGFGIRTCDGNGNWSECIASGDDGGTPDGDSGMGDSSNPGDSGMGDSANPGDSELGGDEVTPGDSDMGDSFDPCNPDPCNGNGDCNAGVCSCYTGFAGENCDGCDSGYIDYPTCSDDPCDPDPCNGNGSCDQADGSCTCTGDWVGETCELEVVVNPNGYNPLQSGGNRVYKFSMQTMSNAIVTSLNIAFDFRSQSGEVTTIVIAKVWLYNDASLLFLRETPLPDNLYVDIDAAPLTTLQAGVPLNYTLEIQIGNFTTGDTLITELTLVTLQDGTEIIVTGKEFTMP